MHSAEPFRRNDKGLQPTCGASAKEGRRSKPERKSGLCSSPSNWIEGPLRWLEPYRSKKHAANAKIFCVSKHCMSKRRVCPADCKFELPGILRSCRMPAMRAATAASELGGECLFWAVDPKKDRAARLDRRVAAGRLRTQVMEACGSAHHWGRELSRLRHDVWLMPAAYVKPYVKRSKTDAADAEAICEAVRRPTMRFVEIKSEDQQAVLAILRARVLVVRQSAAPSMIASSQRLGRTYWRPSPRTEVFEVGGNLGRRPRSIVNTMCALTPVTRLKKPPPKKCLRRKLPKLRLFSAKATYFSWRAAQAFHPEKCDVSRFWPT